MCDKKLRETDRASSSRGSSGRYSALTTSSTRRPMRRVTLTSWPSICGEWCSCCWCCSMPRISRSVTSCTIFSIDRQSDATHAPTTVIVRK